MAKRGKMTARRKVAIATWSAPREPNIYGKMTVDATNMLAYLDALREASGEKVTVTHFMGRVVGEALRKAPGLNGYLRFGKFREHEDVHISFLVALEEGANLGHVKVENIDKKSVSELATEFRALATKLRAGKDEDFKKSNNALRFLPTWLIRPLLFVTGWLTGAAGISVPSLGLKAFPFGAAIITSVGMLGLDEGFAPPAPFCRVPVYVLLGAIRDQPTVIDGELAVRKQMTITATIDHRFMDGFQGAILAKTVRSFFADPWQLGGVERPDAAQERAPAPSPTDANTAEATAEA